MSKPRRRPRMTSHWRAPRLAMLVAGFIVFTAGPTLAQTPAAPGGTAAVAGPTETRVEQQITMLHRELHITSAEEPQWTAFVQVMRENAHRTDTMAAERAKTVASASAVDDITSYAAFEKAHAEDVQRLIPPFTALYAVMSDAQKRNADAFFRRAEHGAETSHGQG